MTGCWQGVRLGAPSFDRSISKFGKRRTKDVKEALQARGDHQLLHTQRAGLVHPRERGDPGFLGEA